MAEQDRPVNGIEWRARASNAAGESLARQVACEHPWGNRKTSQYRRMYCGNCDVDFEPWRVVNDTPDVPVNTERPGPYRDTVVMAVSELRHLRAELERLSKHAAADQALVDGNIRMQAEIKGLQESIDHAHDQLTRAGARPSISLVWRIRCLYQLAFERGRAVGKVPETLPVEHGVSTWPEPIGGGITSPDKPAPKVRLTEEILKAEEAIAAMAGPPPIELPGMPASDSNVDPTAALDLLRERAAARPDRMRPLPVLDPKRDYTEGGERPKWEPPAPVPNLLTGTIRELALEEAARAVEGGSFLDAESLEARWAREVAAMLRRRKGLTKPDHILVRLRGEGVMRQGPRSTLGEFEG